MNTEKVLESILTKVEKLIKAKVLEISQNSKPNLYELEEQTQQLLPQIGQMFLQEVVNSQGNGLQGPTRPCPCGKEQIYHDSNRPLHIQSSLGDLALAGRAYYRCRKCGAHSYPLDEQLALAEYGLMSRYLQEQVGWLFALIPAQQAQETLKRFGWPYVSAKQLSLKAEALGAEIDQELKNDMAEVQADEAWSVPHRPLRVEPEGDRLYAAPDGWMICTTEIDKDSGKAQVARNESCCCLRS